MAWTKEQIEALADKFAQVFVETVEHAGGTAKIVSSDASQQAVEARPATLRNSDVNSDTRAA